MSANIVLTGLMGAGKSTVGRMLKNKLVNYSFVDIDDEIEKQEHLTIPEIFRLKSEQYFRQSETETIKNFSQKQNLIISIGGGAFESEMNRNYLLNCGKVFYLYAPAKILFERIKTNSNRPMLYCENPIERLKELLKQREQNYKKSHFIIDTSNKTIEQVTDEILRKI